MKEKEKEMIEIITTQMEDASVITKAILAEEDAEDAEEATVDAVEEKTTIVSIWKMLNVSIVVKRGTILLTDHSQETLKTMFQSSLKEMLTKKDKQAKKNTEGDDDSLDMNVFEKLIEGITGVNHGR
jgi:hypothetical protein